MRVVRGGNAQQIGEPAARALWCAEACRAEIRPATLTAPGPGEALVRTLYSEISRGTERLVFEGAVPPAEYAMMRAPLQEGEFPFPVKYGYCAVGTVEKGPADLVGRMVFALHPHQDRFVAPVELIVAVPPGVTPERAVLAANMETALNALWDSGAGPGDRIAVVGGGAIGLLICYLAANLPGAEVTLIDPDADRGPIARSFGAGFSTRADAVRDCDVVFHASATAAGLAAALAACGVEATLVEASWYGSRAVEAPLGGAFHSRRLRIVSTQVGLVAPSRRARWTRRRRLAKALDLLADSRLDALIGERVAFEDLPQALPALLARGAKGVTNLVTY
jgi:threonine dehydrogenase-like Zn-dependent dehydrogenase